MKMWITQYLLFILCISLGCVTSTAGVYVSGYEGRDVNVSCSYRKEFQSSNKYLCKNNCGNSDVLITMEKTKNNKYSIHDDTKAHIFTVTISDLKKTDAGKYWCGVSLFGNDIYTEVNVDVGQDSCCNSVTKIQSYKEDSVSISCPYESQYQNNLKYICRGNRPSTCLQQALITSDTKQNGRIRFNDDKVSRKFTVNITSPSLKDSGLYLCGIQRNRGLDIFSAVELKVKEIHIFVYILPTPLVLMLIPTVAWIKVYKCRKARGAEVGMNRDAMNTEEAGELKLMDHIYENRVIEAHSNLDSSEQQSNSHIYDNDDSDHVYEDIPEVEDIYFNYELQ